MLVSKLYLENLLSVDKLHYKEVQILNDLHELILKNKKKKIEKKLEQLVLDVEHHFESEEKRMFKYKYPAANKHQYAHHCSLEKLYEAKRSWKRNKDVS
jgi:hemerythrin-like metal-binding protein